MKRFTVLALVGMVLAALAAGYAAAGGPSGTPLLTPGVEYVDGQVLVGYAPGVSQFAQQLIEGNIQAEHVSTLGAGTRVLRVSKGQVIGKIAQLTSSAGVRYAQPNYIHHADLLPNDASFGQLWGLQNTGQAVLGTTGKAGADISATQAWNVTTGSKTVVVGVVDTGVDYTHPDLAANMWSNPGVAGCPVGTRGYNAITKTCDPMDDHNHGTHVAGTIGGVGNNSIGVAGVNWNVSIMGLKFLDSTGSGSTADAIAAIDFAVNAKIAGVNVRALNNSWGGGPFEQALLDAINRAGANDIMFLAAAGNSSLNNDTNPHYPSSYNAANEIAVAATDQSDGLAYFSNYGATSVHLGAPGTNIYSTVVGGLYDWYNGTSMATPHVAGAAALVLAKCNQTTATLKDILLKSVTPLASLAGRTTTGGRLNVFAAINDPRCTTPPPTTPDYTLSATPASQSVVQGASTSYTVNVNRTGGFTGAVTLSVSGLPAGAAGTFNPNPATGASSVLSVTTSTTTPAGSYPLTVTGTSGTLTRTTSVTLVVTAPVTSDFSISSSPTSRTITRGASTTYAVTVTRTGGFAGSVAFSVSGLPTGATGTYSPTSTTDTTSTLTVKTTSSTPAGTYAAVKITGTSGTLSRSATVTLVVKKR